MFNYKYFVFTILLVILAKRTVGKRIVCYFGSWSVYRTGNGKFSIEDIDPNLCTDLIYSFVGLNSDGSIKILDTYADLDLKGYEKFNDLKKKNTNLKTSLAIGGWSEGSKKYSKVAADPAKRKKLISSAVDFLRKYGFDGFDIDWEYPGQRGGTPQDKKNFISLLKEFRKEFDKHGYVLSVAVEANPTSTSYNVPKISKYATYINVMTYDYHASYDGKTGQNSPLYPSSADTTNYQKTLNVVSSIESWIQDGADPNKLLLGVGFYGHTFKLSSNQNGIGAPTSGPGNPGRYTKEAGMLGYNEICELESKGGWTIKFDDQQKVPYAYKGDQWVGYDNDKSISLKVAFAKSKNLGGIMTWSIETDDFKGICGGKYPLLNAIHNNL